MSASTSDPRVVVVTGASSGIGRAAAHQLSRRGDHVVLVARGQDRLNTTVAECLREGAASATARSLDVGDRTAVDALFAEVREQLGHVDAVVHSAGVAGYGRFTDVEPEILEGVMTTNFLGTANVARAALREFAASETGALVLVGSLLGKIATPYMSPYISSKWAVHALVRIIQLELRQSPDIGVTIVSPGGVDTPIYRWAASSLGRQGQPPPPVDPPEKVAKAIVAALERPRREVSVGLSNHVSVFGFRVFPGLYDRLVTPLMDRFGLDPRTTQNHPGNIASSLPDASQEPYGQHDALPLRVVRRSLDGAAALFSRSRPDQRVRTASLTSPPPPAGAEHDHDAETAGHPDDADHVPAAESVERRMIASPAQVWQVLGDGWLYATWVVGASRTRDVDAAWPAVGSQVHHSFGIWPVMLNDTTQVLVSQPGERLVLRARGEPLGKAEVVITLVAGPDGSTVVTIREDVVSGPGTRLPRRLRQLAVVARNREALRRLAYLSEGSAAVHQSR